MDRKQFRQSYQRNYHLERRTSNQLGDEMHSVDGLEDQLMDDADFSWPLADVAGIADHRDAPPTSSIDLDVERSSDGDLVHDNSLINDGLVHDNSLINDGLVRDNSLINDGLVHDNSLINNGLVHDNSLINDGLVHDGILSDNNSSEVDINVDCSVEQGVEYEYEVQYEEYLDENDEGIYETWPKNYSFLKGKGFEHSLKFFFSISRLSRDHSNLLLAILRNFFKPDLPKDTRTFHKTASGVGSELARISGGSMWYQGVETVLRQYFGDTIPDVSTFTIQVSIDGLPLFNSSPVQFWPILIKVQELPNAPIMPIGIYMGQKKPEEVEQYLRPFVDEMNPLMDNGLEFGDKYVDVAISAFIADSPARSFIKSVKGFQSKHGCTGCHVIGDYLKSHKKVVFDSVDAEPRTDAGFRARLDADHHKEVRSPLEDLKNVDMINSFPVSDRLHLIDRGVTRKILKGLLENDFDRFGHWSSWQRQNISKFMVRTKLPSEVNRPFRGVDLLPFWKATEFRSFLHYISIIIYRDFMYIEAFNHYLLYFSSITIFSSTFHRPNWVLAGRLLKLFVKTFKVHYGRSNLVSNVHNLHNVYRDVLNHGALDDFSAYCFENHLNFLKRCVRSGNRCLEQVVSRSRDFASINNAASKLHCSVTYPKLTPTGIGIQLTADFLLMPNMKDQWFMTRSFGIVKFIKPHKTPTGSFSLVGKLFNHVEELFTIDTEDDIGPLHLSSSSLHMYKVNVDTPVRIIKIPLTAVLCKLVCVPLPHRSLSRYKFDSNHPSETLAFFPLLHTFAS
ncbi:uncharacterized protein LOC125954985 [Anopheles darlingi]|uniref:uncharacterized protein LOC125954985 n=1 Tax=Anopheles darlingi TaxID=43151 RepID=UPI002100112B|nr:uncharacterized protein LOC125954985 [Anopheles darlingi]